MLKFCYKCGEEKDISEFYKDSSRADGLESKCKECKKAYDSIKRKEQWADPQKRALLEKRNAEQFQKNKKERIIKHLEYKKSRRKIDPVFLEKERLLARFNYFIKRSHGTKNGVACHFMGYTRAIAWEHLQKTLPNGYTMQDFLEGTLQLDHIIPQSAFNKMDNKEKQDCYNLRNLRLILKRENNHKKDHIDLELIQEYNIEDLLPKEYN